MSTLDVVPTVAVTSTRRHPRYRSAFRGRLSGRAASPGMVLAIALNGRIRATTWTFTDSGEVTFDAMLPPTGLRRGSNRIEVLAVSSGPPGPRLTRISRDR